MPPWSILANLHSLYDAPLLDAILNMMGNKCFCEPFHLVDEVMMFASIMKIFAHPKDVLTFLTLVSHWLIH